MSRLVLAAFLAVAMGALGAPSALGQAGDLRLGPDDTLYIQVWDNPDLEREVTLNRRGEFQFPHVGTVPANGLTVEEVQRLLTERLADGYLVNPQVNVSVRAYRSRKINVTGPIQNPGALSITKNISLIDLLAIVNVKQDEADDIVRIFHPVCQDGRPSDEKQANEGEPIEVNWKKLLEGCVKYNIELTDGDVVVFRLKSERRVYVLGEVKNPGPVNLKPDMRLMDAIAAAGGPTDAGAEELLLTQRPRNFPGERDPEVQRFDFRDVCAGKVGMDIILQDGNTVIIPQSNKKLVFVHGRVRKPGQYDWVPKMTVEKAVATAGGVDEFGTWKGIRLLREAKDGQSSRRAGSDDEVQPGDIIYVPEGWF